MRPTSRLALLLFAVAAPGAAAQETASDTLLTVNHYLDWEQVADPQISPDGAQIVYTRRWVNKVEDKWESALWIMNADGSHNRFLVKGSDARWSPGPRTTGRRTGAPSCSTGCATRRGTASMRRHVCTRWTSRTERSGRSPRGRGTGPTPPCRPTGGASRSRATIRRSTPIAPPICG